MQKKLIALAVAGLASSAAFAQSNVTIYGIADVAYLHSSSGSSKTTGIDAGGWSSSRLGFKGTEDLGDGMKAIFTLEYGITPDVNGGIGNTGGTNSRQTFVGLQSASAGTIRLGRFNSVGKDMTDKYDAMAATTFSPLYSMQRGNGNTAANGTGLLPKDGGTSTHTLTTQNIGRVSNGVAYTSPNLSGFTLSAQYAYGNVDQNDALAYTGAHETTVVVGADYTNGPLAVGFAHHRSRDLGTAAVAGVYHENATENFIGGSFDFGVAKLMATFQNVKRDTFTAPAGRLATDKFISVGVQVPVTTAGKLYFGWANANDGSAANNDSNSWGIQYGYDLSKRTLLYTGYQRVSNNNAAASSVLSNQGGGGGRAAVAPGANTTGYGFGIRHTF